MSSMLPFTFLPALHTARLPGSRTIPFKRRHQVQECHSPRRQTIRLLAVLALVAVAAALALPHFPFGPTIALAQGSESKTTETKGSEGKESPQSRIGFLHTPPKPESFPFPGQSMTISVGLSNTRETRFPIRVVVSRDGRFMEIPAKEAYLDKYDRPIYEMSLPAPVAEISYQMFMVTGEDQVLASPRYTVRRNCIPQVALAAGEVPSEVQGTERLKKLIQESRALENDLKGYEQSLELLAELEKVIG